MNEVSFYEIEYDTNPVQDMGKMVLKPQKVAVPEKDEVRNLFVGMRNISRSHRSSIDMSYFSSYYFSKLFDRQVQRDNAVIFYKQGKFMKDFTDDYSGNTPLSQFFPSYQMMGYEQLRTYFTWRTKVRQGVVADTSLSYAFLYIYELLNNINVANPKEGLEKLMFFQKAYNAHNKSIDKYILRWLKDYHIYYDLPQSFREFVEQNNLTQYYPEIVESNDNFDLFCAISKYDIRKSAFYTDETKNRITGCFSFLLERIKQEFEVAGMHFDDVFFRPTRKLIVWEPFRDALFHPWLKQNDRRIVLSENEIYVCKNNEWTVSTVITSEKGKQFIGYVLKQMEAELRKVMKYRFTLAANKNMVHPNTIRVLEKKGLFIERIIPDAVVKFYREATKTVVTVDHTSLARIRREALITQEALIVEEQKDIAPLSVIPPVEEQNLCEDSSEVTFVLEQNPFGEDSATTLSSDQNQSRDVTDTESIPVSDRWERLKDDLSEHELQALAVLLQGGDIKMYAANHGIMPEVLMDGINIKAMDYIGDNLMDEEFVLYEDYLYQVKKLIV